MSGARGRDLLRHHYESDCFVADGEAGKACGQVIVTTDLSSSSLSAVDLSLDVGASDMDWGSSAHTSSMDRSFNPIDTVPLESFPWADLSIFQDEEMNAKGIDLDALGTLPVNVDFSNISDGQAPGISVQDTSSAENTEEGKQCRSKRPRGPKPKYVFSDPEQAAAARRERNRATALQSYYKKKNHTKNLELQVWELEEENNKLIQLLQHVEEGSVSIQDEGDIEKHIDAISC